MINGLNSSYLVAKSNQGVPGGKPIENPEVYKEKPGQRPEGGFKGGEEVEVEGPDGELYPEKWTIN